MTKEFLGKTKNGCDVYVDLETSHAATHIQDTPELLGLVKGALQEIEPTENYHEFELDMGHVIGTSDLVETSEDDEIVYAKRRNRDTYTRFVRNKDPIPTQFLTLCLEKMNDDAYNLYSTWAGPNCPSSPDSIVATPESKPFWEKHALVWGTQEVISGTETIECPW